jgi:hypothetical protein
MLVLLLSQLVLASPSALNDLQGVPAHPAVCPVDIHANFTPLKIKH